MEKPMTTSSMTSGQIDRACEIFRAQLKKHASKFPSDAVQLAFGQPEFGRDLLYTFRKRVDAFSDMIIRHVHVNRSLSPQEVLDATRRRQSSDKYVVESIPRGDGEEVEVFFFKVSRWLSDKDLEKEYELRWLRPDFSAQAQVNIDDPAFADEHPNGMSWEDAKGTWCFVSFYSYDGERRVDVNHNESSWGHNWWFAGVRK